MKRSELKEIITEVIAEAVILPEIAEIKSLLLANKYKLIGRNLNPIKLALLLSGILQKLKIKFKYDSSTEYVLSAAGYDAISGDISVEFGNPFVELINDIKPDENLKYSKFVDMLIDIIFSHEMIHRKQYQNVLNKKVISKIRNSDINNPKEYLASPQEQMAYAHDAVKEMINQGLTKVKALELIKSPEKLRNSYKDLPALDYFRDTFDNNDLSYKKFQKYMYEYIQQMYR